MTDPIATGREATASPQQRLARPLPGRALTAAILAAVLLVGCRTLLPEGLQLPAQSSPPARFQLFVVNESHGAEIWLVGTKWEWAAGVSGGGDASLVWEGDLPPRFNGQVMVGRGACTPGPIVHVRPALGTQVIRIRRDGDVSVDAGPPPREFQKVSVGVAC